jgi:aldehyde dehydrogenase (NAD+)
VNAYRVVAPNVPFEGVKASGIGRENGADALHEYLETKSVPVHAGVVGRRRAAAH